MVTAAYPTQKRSFTDKVDEEDIVFSEHVNLLQAELEAVQTELGISPSAAHDTVADFLADLNSTKYEEGNALKSASGTVSAPGHGFSAEAGLGMLRPAPGTLGFAAGGAEVMRLSGSGASLGTMEVTSSLTVTGSTTGIDHGALVGLSDNADHPQFSLLDGTRAFTGPVGGVAPTNATHLATKAYVDTRFPSGSIVFTGRTSAPTGWLLCHGQAVSRTTYSLLFDAIGTTYGDGDGSTTFNIPDLRQRFPLTKAASGTGVTLGSTGGSIDHSHTNPNVNSNGNHNHSAGTIQSAGTHLHAEGTLQSYSETSGDGSGPSSGQAGSGHGHQIDGHTASNGSHNHTQNNTGSNGNHAHSQGSTGSSNPPYLVLNSMIKI